MFVILVSIIVLCLIPKYSESSSAESLTPKDVSLSKSLSWLLRHGAISEGLKVSEDGFVLLEDVLQHRLFARRCAPADIRRVVNLSKNRFTLRANPVTGIYEIRANSGHTFKDQNNQEGQKSGVKLEVKQNQGRAIPQSGLRSGKNNKNNNKPQKHKIDDLLKNYNIPVGNIASDENHKKRGKANFYGSLMKYPELKKALLWILRYGSEKEGLTVKRHGYVPVNEILTHSYFKNKCMRQDIITVAENEPHNFKLRESPTSRQLYIRARKEHPIKQEQEDWSVIPDVIYLPLGFVIHGINGSEWDFVSEHGLKVPKLGYVYCSPYYAADSWHTRGVTKYDDIYIYINCDAAMQDGIEFFLTPEYSVATKGDKDGFIRTQYFKKVIDAKTGTRKFSPKDLEKIFMKYGQVSKVEKNPSKPFAFIQFVEKESVEKALTARIFAGGKQFFVHRYENRNLPHQEDNKDKARKLSETLSNTSQTEDDGAAAGGGGGKERGVGVKELPVEIAEPDEWNTSGDTVLWQAQNFVSQVELPPEMYQSLYEVKSDMENLYRPVLPGCQVVVFGSCGSTLAFKNSDVDLFLQTPDGEQLKDFVRKEAKEMYRSRLFRVVTRIPSARVPIVKFEHMKTGWQGDLTASSQLGVCNSLLIRFLVSLDPRIKPLVMVIKYWAKVVGVTGSNNKFTTYSLVMLVIHYLQQLDPPMLPSIARLQQMCEHKQFSLGWECSFCNEEWVVQSECLPRPNCLTLRQLLTGFFRLYLNFDYNNVICPLLGTSVPVKDFESDDGADLPDEMMLYREKLKSDPKCKFRTDVNIKMQDPFELCLNITRNVAEGTFLVFKEACKVSLELCDKEEDAELLKSLFSIDEESLNVVQDCVKVYLHFNEEGSTSTGVSEDRFAQWYQLTIDSIMIVFDKVFKLKVEPYCEKVGSKVKKLELSQDVHNPKTSNDSENLVLLCSGKSDVWNSRRKMCKFMNSINIALNPFEREVCISNALYQPSGSKSFNFILNVSPLKDLKNEGKVIEVVVKMKQFGHPLVKGFIQSMKTDFRDFVMKARDFINTVKKSPVTEVKESLKELFELKLQNLPDLKGLIMKKNQILHGKSKDEKEPNQNVQKGFNTGGDCKKGSTDNKYKGQNEKEINKQKSGMKFLNAGGYSDKERIDNESKTKTTPGPSETSDTRRPEQKTVNIDTTNPEENCGSPYGGPVVPNNAIENEVIKRVLSPKNLPSTKTQTLIDAFFKPSSPSEVTDMVKESKHLQYTEVDKFHDLLNTVQQIETQSTFTSENGNPFMAAIEKFARKPFTEETKSEEIDEMNTKSALSKKQNEEKIIVEKESEEFNKIEKKSAQSKAQNDEYQERTNIDENEEAENVRKPEEQEHKCQEGEIRREVNAKNHGESESDKKIEPGKDKSFPSSSQEKTNEESCGNKNQNNQVGETKIYLQRPKIHSERPFKQKKANMNRYQPWVGGGPPGCQPLPKPTQPHASTAQNPQPHQNNRGNYRGSRRHQTTNRNIQWQKKCYPGLFDGNV